MAGNNSNTVWWQVFLTIARKAEVEAAALEGRSIETVHLPDGAVLKVPLGEEFATVEGGTVQYQVKWAQDESGNLQVFQVTLYAWLLLGVAPVCSRAGYDTGYPLSACCQMLWHSDAALCSFSLCLLAVA